MIDNHSKHNLDMHADHSDEFMKSELTEPHSDQDEVSNSKDDQIIQLRDKLIAMQEQEKDTVLRLKAEIENIRRRNMQEIEKAHKFALERFILELLPVIDNLERTISIIDRSNTTLSTIIEGIDLTLKSFLDTIRKFGVESVHDVHVSFNPEIHQAISTIASEEHQSNQVLSVIQKGYLLNGRLIRPAMVTVSKFEK